MSGASADDDLNDFQDDPEMPELLDMQNVSYSDDSDYDPEDDYEAEDNEVEQENYDWNDPVNFVDESLQLNASQNEAGSASNQGEFDGDDEVESGEKILTGKDKKWFDRHYGHCNHEACKFESAVSTAASFHSMPEEERMYAVRMMMFSTSTPTGQLSDLVTEESLYNAGLRQKDAAMKGDSDDDDDSDSSEKMPTEKKTRPVGVYLIRGKKICRNAFAAVVHVHPRTLSKLRRDMAAADGIHVRMHTRVKNRTGKFGPQIIIVRAFINMYANDNGLESPVYSN